MLSQNPFLTLDVSVRHDRRRIVEQAEAQSLSHEPELCRDARATLMTPRRRLAAEVAWLPGVAPGRARTLAQQAVAGDVTLSVAGLDGVPPLAACNLLGTLLVQASSRLTEAELASCIMQLARRYELIDPESVRRALNEDRAIAGFPEVPEASVVSEEIERRSEGLLRSMLHAIGRTARPEVFLTTLVELHTEAGRIQAPRLIEGLADQYKLQVQASLEKLADHIEGRIAKLDRALGNANPEAAWVKASIAEIEQLSAEWDHIAQPLQLIAHSQGTEEPTSHRLAVALRELSVTLWNDHDLRAESRQLAMLVASLFKELPGVAEQVAHDLGTIEKLMAEQAQRKAKSRAEREAWEREIGLELAIGSSTLKISGDSISYNGARIPTDGVTAVRWGIYKHYVNGVRVNRQYTIWVARQREEIAIECVRMFESEETVQKRYGLILEKLWKAVCRRLVVETLGALSSGGELSYGGVRVNREGVVLSRRKSFLSSEPIHYKWADLIYGDHGGSLVIRSRSEKASAEMAYRDVWNVHILEALLNFLWKDGNHLRLARGEFGQGQGA